MVGEERRRARLERERDLKEEIKMKVRIEEERMKFREEMRSKF